MADKGFDIKVLIPTDDGITVSDKPIGDAPYYLMYNLSNRSYQLAGKVRTRELKETITDELNLIIKKQKVDFVISNKKISNIDCGFIKTEFLEINQTLNNLIDKIDQKKELI